MRKAALSLLAVLAAPSLAAAGEFELTAYGGYTFPFYGQTFQYDPGPVTVPIPGITVEQGGTFEIKTSGDLAFGGAFAFYVTGGFGFEVRYDHADMKVETQSSFYNVRVGLPAPLDPVVANIVLSGGSADLKAVTPFSLNLKLRTGGSVRLMASGGASHLGDLQFTVQQSVGLGVVGFDFVENNVKIGTIGVQATSPAGTGGGWGGNLGLGLQISLGERAALVFEGRGFYFPKRTVEWAPILDQPLTDFEKALLARVQERLPPVEFRPWWVQASVGLAIRF